MALENVALIKVDTQGADLRVLRGAEGTIRCCQPTGCLNGSATSASSTAWY
jgi:FkbM family methyltransferase